MKQLISFAPKFSPSIKAVDFSAKPDGFSLNKLYAIVNVTRGVAIYGAGLISLGITSIDALNPSLIYLQFDTTAHSSSDILNVYYDVSPSSFIDGNVALEKNGNIQMIQETLDQMLVEMRVQTLVLSEGFNGRNLNRDDILALRTDINNIINDPTTI
jgi:hypothetical protein